jgi:type II secretory pathway component PulM
VTTRLTAWLTSLSRRERTLLTAAGALTLGVVVLGAVVAVHDELTALRARVAGRERELGEVRRLAARLRQEGGTATAAPKGALFTRLQAAVDESVGRERLAAMTPAEGPVEGGLAEERVAVSVRGATLTQVVALLHALEGGTPPLPVSRVELRKRADDPTRFDAAVEVVELRPAS